MKDLILSMVCADILSKELRIPGSVWKYSHIMTRPEARLVNEFRNMYPDYKIVLLNF